MKTLHLYEFGIYNQTIGTCGIRFRGNTISSKESTIILRFKIPSTKLKALNLSLSIANPLSTAFFITSNIVFSGMKLEQKMPANNKKIIKLNIPLDVTKSKRFKYVEVTFTNHTVSPIQLAVLNANINLEE